MGTETCSISSDPHKTTLLLTSAPASWCWWHWGALHGAAWHPSANPHKQGSKQGLQHSSQLNFPSQISPFSPYFFSAGIELRMLGKV